MKEEINLIYGAGLSWLLMEHIFLCGRQSLTGEVCSDYRTAFMSGGLWGLTNEWVLRDMKETPDEMEKLFTDQAKENSDK